LTFFEQAAAAVHRSTAKSTRVVTFMVAFIGGLVVVSGGC